MSPTPLRALGLYRCTVRFWSVKRIDPFGEPSVNVSDDRLRSRVKAELGKSVTTTLLVRENSCPKALHLE